ncbi:acetylxylan esterase [Cohnella fermenti]|uniref:Acetylxylan esterase n=1 Tax=Cohnella fermenti TaxID=2565925 RepID=A0A4V3WEQ3_9BACL|nr:acetylxylan esterase [Cohnella fermenti]
MVPSSFRTPQADCFDLYFTGVREARIHAKYIRPANAAAPHPAVIVFHGYSGNSGDWPLSLCTAVRRLAAHPTPCSRRAIACRHQREYQPLGRSERHVGGSGAPCAANAGLRACDCAAAGRYRDYAQVPERQPAQPARSIPDEGDRRPPIACIALRLPARERQPPLGGTKLDRPDRSEHVGQPPLYLHSNRRESSRLLRHDPLARRTAAL